MKRAVFLVLIPFLLGVESCTEKDFFTTDLALATDGFGPENNGSACVHCHSLPMVDGEDTIGGFGFRYRSPVLVRNGTGPVERYFRFEDPRPIPASAFVATRLPPPLGGLAAVDGIADEAILANADPRDANRDGISGRVGGIVDGRVLRYGRQAHGATLVGFIEEALAGEHGFFPEEGSEGFADLLETFLLTLPPPTPWTWAGADPQTIDAGEAIFDAIGCADCHTPALDGVPLYSDLLLHDLGPSLDDHISLNPDCRHAVAADNPHSFRCSTREFRTASLLGVGHRRAALLHDGRAQTLEMAVRLHGGEAAASRDAWMALSRIERRDLREYVVTR